MSNFQQVPAVYSVVSPSCCWTIRHQNVEAKDIYKPKRWITNCRILAEALDHRCRDAGGEVWQMTAELFGGVAQFAAAFPSTLVDMVLKVVRDQMLADGSLRDIETVYRTCAELELV